MADSGDHMDIGRLLFETGAIRVAPDDKPFWYTSGTIGPYYSNTQNLIGGEAEAGELLGLMDGWLSGDRLLLPGKVTRRIYEAYTVSACYRTVAGLIEKRVGENAGAAEIDVVSGGARRDWFFSFMTAALLNKPHLTIYKDLSMVLSEPWKINSGAGTQKDKAVPVNAGDLSGMRCIHVSDIITEASSYERAWLPALACAGASINMSLTVLDRAQGGKEFLESRGVKLFSVETLDAKFWKNALKRGYIDGGQYKTLINYFADPNAAMRTFLTEHPEFIKNALSAGGKETERARMCLDSGVYGCAAGQ